MTIVKAKAKWVRTSPRKVQRVMDLIRGKRVEEALALLSFMPQKAARLLAKTIKSAAANAKNNYKMVAGLKVVEVYVNKGVDLKRIRPRARGRAFSIKKRTSHLTVGVSTDQA